MWEKGSFRGSGARRRHSPQTLRKEFFLHFPAWIPHVARVADPVW